MPTPKVLRAIDRQLEKLSTRWGRPKLAASVRVKFTSGLRISVARCNPRQGVIRLSSALLAGRNRRLLSEALAHEAAHVAIYSTHGPEVRPHGTEWQDLMRAAGFEPRLRLRLPDPPTQAARPRVSRFQYEYRCPVCQSVHRTRRRDSRILCRPCVEAGLSGVMTITRRSVAAESESR